MEVNIMEKNNSVAFGVFKGYFMIVFWPVTLIMWMCGCFKNKEV